MPSNVKNLKALIKAKVEALLVAASITVYESVKDSDARFPFAVVEYLFAAAGGQQDVSGYTVDMTITVYAKPDRTSHDDIDDYLDLLEEGLHAHSEQSSSVNWHWQSTQMVLRRNLVQARNVRAGIIEFQISAKEV